MGAGCLDVARVSKAPTGREVTYVASAKYQVASAASDDSA